MISASLGKKEQGKKINKNQEKKCAEIETLSTFPTSKKIPFTDIQNKHML